MFACLLALIIPIASFTDHTGDVKDVRLEEGVVKATATGIDSKFWTRLPRPFTASASQVVYLKARCSVGGFCQLFWEQTNEVKFTGDQSVNFYLPKDGEWHTYRFRPVWSGSVDGLRLDFPDVTGGFKIEIASFEIREEGARVPESVDGTSGVVFDLQMPPGLHYATFTWGGTHTGRKAFETATDGRSHTYYLALKDEPSWKGMVDFACAEQFRKCRDLPAKNLHFVKGIPSIAGDLDFSGVGSLEAIPRAGRPFTLEAVVRNFGTLPASNVTFTVEGLPPSVRLLDPAELHPALPQPGNDGRESVGAGNDCKPQLKGERIYRIHLSDLGVGEHTLKVTLSAAGTPPRTRELKVKVLPSLNLPPADYVPEPQPVSTAPYEIGAMIFPGWPVHGWQSAWSHALWRKPVLGWYDETNPETIDWQIKQLAENGVSFVAVDWYWCEGKLGRIDWFRHFRNARYRRYLKWAVHWCNHNDPGTHSVEDQKLVTKYWIDNYFGDPQYQYIDGKPVVYIYAPQNMERDLKAQGGCRMMLELSRKMAREAGYKGIYFVGVRASDRETREYLQTFVEWGFDETCVYRYMGYNIPDLPTDAEGNAPYRWLAETSLRHWRSLFKATRLPFMPSVSTSWDNRPWLGEFGFERTGYNVADFKRICVDAKRFSDETGVRRLLLGPLDEWGEGEIGYPNAEFGFGILEAVRETFARKPASGWPQNIAPEDVGRHCPQKDDGSNPRPLAEPPALR